MSYNFFMGLFPKRGITLDGTRYTYNTKFQIFDCDGADTGRPYNFQSATPHSPSLGFCQTKVKSAELLLIQNYKSSASTTYSKRNNFSYKQTFVISDEINKFPLIIYFIYNHHHRRPQNLDRKPLIQHPFSCRNYLNLT